MSRGIHKFWQLEPQAVAEPAGGTRGFLRTVWFVLATGVCYYSATRIAWALCFPDSKVSLFFPPHAVLVSILLLVPTRHWWAYTLAAAIAHFLATQQAGWPPLYALHCEVFDAVQNVAVAGGIRIFIRSPLMALKLRDSIAFVVIAVVLVPFGTAFWGAALTVFHGFGTYYWIEWRNLGISNAVTAVVLIPALLLGAQRLIVRRPKVSSGRALEAALLVASTVAVGILVFGQTPAGPGTSPPLLYLTIPPLIWAALRFGLGGVSVSVLIITFQAIWGTMHGRGPFLTQTPAENALALQSFLLMTGTPLMLLAVVIEEERRSQDALRESKHQMGLAAEAANAAMWVWDVSADDLWMTEHGRSLFGFKPDARINFAATMDRVLPEDRAARESAIKRALETRGGYEIEYRLLEPDSVVRWINGRARCAEPNDGTGLKLYGVSIDVTARKQSEESLRGALHEVSRLKDRLEAHNTYLQEELTASESDGDIICRSQIMRQMLEQSQRVARTDSTVLILGETGVGKELLARAIHRSSNRADHPFVRLNCAALPPHLIESELFGHERGAFTGAASRRLGRFEVADGATLFLDEIGELPLELQAKLLRVLQEEEFERLGSSKTIKVDVRLIAATSRDLIACVQGGTFRADLYYRLNVFPITVPPLRSRTDDIIPLASAFLAAASTRLGREFGPISNAVADSLLRHDWPGNVRELENVIERAAISSRGEVLELPLEWASPGVGIPSGVVQDSPDTSRGTSTKLPVAIREMERSHLLAALDKSKWRIEGPEGAASLLGMKPSTLRFRMKKLAIARTRN